MPYREPEIRQLPERLVACLSYTGNYVGNTELFARLFTQLGNWAGTKGLFSPETQFLSSYANDPRTTPADELRLDVCMSVAEGTDVDGDVQLKVLPGGSYAVLHAEMTDPKEYESAWRAIVDWAQDSSVESDLSRPSYEIYLNNPDEHPQKHQLVDLCLSVRAQ